jgi:hypothetical protein
MAQFPQILRPIDARMAWRDRAPALCIGDDLSYKCEPRFGKKADPSFAPERAGAHLGVPLARDDMVCGSSDHNECGL